jgi:hypothetical protein
LARQYGGVGVNETIWFPGARKSAITLHIEAHVRSTAIQTAEQSLARQWMAIVPTILQTQWAIL